jgi:hypothetical protein
MEAVYLSETFVCPYKSRCRAYLEPHTVPRYSLMTAVRSLPTVPGSSHFPVQCVIGKAARA